MQEIGKYKKIIESKATNKINNQEKVRKCYCILKILETEKLTFRSICTPAKLYLYC